MKTKLFFEAHPVFHYKEFASYMQSQGIHRPASWRQQLSYHHKTGQLLHIRKNLYAVKPYSKNENEFWVDPFLIAGKTSTSSVIAYHSALELLGFAYTTFEEITYLTDRPAAIFTFQNQRFRPIQYPKNLIGQHAEQFGIETVQRQEVELRVTGLERTLVDILDKPDLGGGWEEIWRSFDFVPQFDSQKLIHYTLLLKNATTVAKVGYFLESRPPQLRVEERYINQLLPHIPKQPHYMNRNKREKGKYINKWQLIVPFEIIHRTWEEPNDGNY